MRNPIRPHPQCTANKARASAAGTSRCRIDARELQPLHAQNFPFRAPQVNDATVAATVPNGGYACGRCRLIGHTLRARRICGSSASRAFGTGLHGRQGLEQRSSCSLLAELRQRAGSWTYLIAA